MVMVHYIFDLMCEWVEDSGILSIRTLDSKKLNKYCEIV